MGQAARESFRVRRIGRREHGRPRGNALLCQAVMHIGRRQEAESRMMVLGVVPGEEEVAVSPGILDRAEPLREGRPILQRLEIKVRERRRDAVRTELKAFGTPAQAKARTTSEVRAELVGYLHDWRAMAHQGVAEARRLLRAVLVGRFVFTPVPRPPDLPAPKGPG